MFSVICCSVIFILQIVVSLVMLNDILSVMQFSGYYNGAYPGTARFRRVCGVQRDRVCALDRDDDRIFGTRHCKDQQGWLQDYRTDSVRDLFHARGITYGVPIY